MSQDWTLVGITTVADGETSAGLADRLLAERQALPWPEGLDSVSWYTDLDGEVVLTMYRCESEDSLQTITGTDSYAYRVYGRSGAPWSESAGCVNIVIRKSTDRESAEAFIDALVQRSQANPGIGTPVSASFHVGTDGATTLLYSEWKDKQAHDDHMAGMRRTMADLYAGLPGPISFHQYRYHRSLRVRA
jgi:quinol monooxygenase YgiN